MPSKSPKQARTMAAAAHNPQFAAKLGISQSVAREFNQADKGSTMFSKGSKPQTASYAAGGPVLGRTREFLKTPDRFREDDGKNDENWAKGSGEKLTPKDKSLKAVKPKG